MNSIFERIEIQRARDKCLKKWKNKDGKIKEFNNNFIKWINSIPKDNRKEILKLIKKFDYYSKDVVFEKMKQIHTILSEKYNITESDTIYSYIKKSDGTANSSIEYLCNYKIINDINHYDIITDLASIKKENYEKINNIVFIDDCTGSGDSIIKFFGKNYQIIKDKKIYILIIHILQTAYRRITEYAKEKNIVMNIIYINYRKKVFTKSNELKEFISLSENKLIPREQILGYKRTQGVVAFYNNTPNNTLGIFSINTSNNKALFPRINDPYPNWRKEAKERELQNLRNIKNG